MISMSCRRWRKGPEGQCHKRLPLRLPALRQFPRFCSGYSLWFAAGDFFILMNMYTYTQNSSTAKPIPTG